MIGGSATGTDAVVATGGIAGLFNGMDYTVEISSDTKIIEYIVMHKNTNSGSIAGGRATNAYTGGLVGMEKSEIAGGPGVTPIYETLVFDCNKNTGTVKDTDGNNLTYLVGWSADSTDGKETYQPLTTLKTCDGTCSSTSGE